MCDLWRRSFEAFIADVGNKPTPEHTLDRIDTNGDYEPANVRWATRKQQARNTRANHRLTFNGETLCLAEWAERMGFKYSTIVMRLKLGWTVEQALTAPLVPPQGRYVGFGHRAS